MSEDPRPWVVEQYLDMDLPGDVGHQWLLAAAFATEAEAVAFRDTQRGRLSPASVERWRVRRRADRLAEFLAAASPQQGADQP
jgi:hypothetical protein